MTKTKPSKHPKKQKKSRFPVRRFVKFSIHKKDEFKRNFRDSVFCALCRKKRNLADILLFLHPEYKHVNEKDIHHVTLSATITNSVYNDVSFIYQNRLFVFLEAQSTWNSNMAFRIGSYAFRALEKYISMNGLNKYQKNPISLPTPELFVIYTGSDFDSVKDRISLREENFSLPFAFDQTISFPFSVESRAKVLYNKGKNKFDGILKQYVRFVNVAERLIEKHHKCPSSTVRYKTLPKRIFRVCIRLDILREFFRENEDEIMNILDSTTEREDFLRIVKKEQREEGRKEGQSEERHAIIKNMLSENIPYPMIARVTNSTLDAVSKLAKELGVFNPALASM